MKRRNWLMAGAGVAAAVAGVAWQRRPRGPNGPNGPNGLEAGSDAPPATAAPGAAAAGSLWQMSFEKPAGGTFAMASLRGQPLLLNFWATWCPPCVKEMPELELFSKQFAPQGWRVVGLAVDNPKAVREFLARTPVSYTIGLAGFEGSELSRSLGNQQSGLPYTVAFDRDGKVIQRKAGAATLEELSRWTALR